MAFAFGLGSETMLNQFQRDATLFKLQDMSGNIQKYGAQVGSAASYLDTTFTARNRVMQQDQENDNTAVFLLEYQALLRARIQQMITELTAAMTRDLDAALLSQRPGVWNRMAAQGNGTTIEDAGAARIAYGFMSGYAQNITPASAGLNTAPNSIPYVGNPSPEDGVNRVSPDTSADALFQGVNAPNGDSRAVRVAGTATIQQSFAQDNNPRPVIDAFDATHQNNSVLYGEIGGGFITHTNRYKFINPEANRTDAQNIGFSNASNANNLNDDDWEAAIPTDRFRLFNRSGNAKNEFQRVLYDTIFELDQRNLLRDVFRLSNQNSFFNGVQIATTSSLTTGSQAQASVFLNYVPTNSSREDLGGNIEIIMDRFSAFYHC